MLWRGGIDEEFSPLKAWVANSMWRNLLKNIWRILRESSSWSVLFQPIMNSASVGVRSPFQKKLNIVVSPDAIDTFR